MSFALFLLLLLVVTGAVWALEALWLRRSRPEGEKQPWWVEYSVSFFPVILIVFLLRSFLVEPFKIPSSSMVPTLLVGDFILVNKFTYGIRLPVANKKIVELGAPKRGDVMVFRFPDDPSLDYIKRVIGLPGDEITYRNKIVYVNGKEVPQTYLGPYVGSGDEGRKMAGAEARREMLPGVEHDILTWPLHAGAEGTFRVPAGHYFAMGDNRDNSEDSRYWGFVPEANLVGRAFVIWMNWDSGIDFKRIGTLIK